MLSSRAILVIVVLIATSIIFYASRSISEDERTSSSLSSPPPPPPQILPPVSEQWKINQFLDEILPPPAPTTAAPPERCEHAPLRPDEVGGCTLLEEDFVLHRFGQFRTHRAQQFGRKGNNRPTTVVAVGRGLGVGYAAASTLRSLGLFSASRFGFALSALDIVSNSSLHSATANMSTELRGSVCDGNGGCTCECVRAEASSSSPLSAGLVEFPSFKKSLYEWILTTPSIAARNVLVRGLDLNHATSLLSTQVLQQSLDLKNDSIVRFVIATNETDEKLSVPEDDALSSRLSVEKRKTKAWTALIDEEMNWEHRAIDVLSISSSPTSSSSSSTTSSGTDIAHYSRVLLGAKKLLARSNIGVLVIRGQGWSQRRDEPAAFARVVDQLFNRWKYRCYVLTSAASKSSSKRLLVPVSGVCWREEYAEMIAGRNNNSSWSLACHSLNHARVFQQLMEEQRVEYEERNKQAVSSAEEVRGSGGNASVCRSERVADRVFPLLATDTRAERLWTWIKNV